MRKILIISTVAFFAFYSCKKETAPNSAGNLQTLSKPTVSASGIITEPLGVDLTGFELLDLCSSEICTAVSGTVVFYIAFDGNVKPLGVYNFVFRDRNATMYRGEYRVELEPFTWLGEISNIYKLIFNPRGVSSNKVLLALVRIKDKENGVYTVQIDNGTIECP